MKQYFKRLLNNAKPWELAIWWGVRLALIYAFVRSLLQKPADTTMCLQIGSNLTGTFVWEVFQMSSEKRFTRHMSTHVQDVLVFALLCGSFFGCYKHFYYNVRFWDSGMHLIMGGLTVYIGYEIVQAIQKRDKITVPAGFALLCGLGLSFMVSTLWELFEFTSDQVTCMIGGLGDAQHWCYALAQGTPKENLFIPAMYPDRWPLMDTMQDIVLNTVGAFIAWVMMKVIVKKKAPVTVDLKTEESEPVTA